MKPRLKFNDVKHRNSGDEAQEVERPIPNREAAGSTPAVPAPFFARVTERPAGAPAPQDGANAQAKAPRLEQRCGHGFIRSQITCDECERDEKGTPLPIIRDVSLRHSQVSRDYHCRACGERGHNRTTCPNRKPLNQGPRESK